MQVQLLAKVDLSVVTALLSQVRPEVENAQSVSTFDGMPVRVLFPPEKEFPASLHYMFFPKGAFQRFHRHPDGRHLILLGDTSLRIRYSSAAPYEDPHPTAIEVNIEPGYMVIVRSPPDYWHEFSAPGNKGTGILAFSFHDRDSDPTYVSDMMMRDTVFFDEIRHNRASS